MNKKLALIACAAALFACTAASAQETRIATKPVQKDGLIITASYLGPEHLAMAPMLPGMHAPADIHLETDILADKDNPQGLQPGTWIPYLTITYQMKKKGSDWSTFGRYMPMIANDGMHYGNNVKMDGPGTYTLALHIEPPPYASFYRHTDKEIGVPEWWTPFNVSWTFDYPAKTAKQ
jgi:uncharacterized protein involved in high-affinity Fe2+ transport